MSDNKSNNSINVNADRERFRQLHNQLQNLLAAYVDGELDEHEVDIIEAHLSGCESCRLDVERQKLLSQRLFNIQPVTAPERLNELISQTVDKEVIQQNACLMFLKRGYIALSRYLAMRPLGWAVAAVLLLVVMIPNLKISTSKIPMIEAAVSNYQQAQKRNFMYTSTHTDSLMPMEISGGLLLAKWTTTIEGEKAEAFVIKIGSDIVIQYRISQDLFYRNTLVRKSVSSNGNFRQREDDLEVLAIPTKRAGLLVVGPKNIMPSVLDMAEKTM